MIYRLGFNALAHTQRNRQCLFPPHVPAELKEKAFHFTPRGEVGFVYVP